MRRMGIGLGIGINRSNYAQGIFGAYQSRVIADGGVTEAGNCVNAVSSLLQSASLLLIPSGYKSGKAYAEIPTNGNGDLTWTRASDAWRTNADGLIQRVPWNLLQRSEEFDNAIWGKTNATISANSTTAPNGTLTADKIVASAVSANHFANQGYNTLTGIATISIYAKAAEYQYLRIQELNTGKYNSRFDLLNGTAIGDAGASIQNVGNGWYRCIITFDAGGGNLANGVIGIPTLSTPINYTGDGTSGVFIWGAQLVEGSSAQTYFPTTDRLNVPRLSYMYGSCPALLLEPQRTNSIRNSTMAGASTSPSTLPTNWVRQNTSGLTQSVAGVGTENGVNYIDINLQGTATGANDAYSFDQTISGSVGQNWTNSWYLKLVSSAPNAVRLAVQEFNGGAFLNVVTQDITPTTTLTRYSQTKTLSDATVTNVRAMIYANFVIGQTYNTTIRIAQPQMELGAYATTPIPTTTASATRIADSFSRSNIYTNGLITSSGGTWFVELRGNLAYTRDASSRIGFGDTSNLQNNSFFLNPQFGGGRFLIFKSISNTLTQLFTTTTSTIKVAIKWNGSTADVFVNGTKQVSATAFTTTNMEFLFGDGVGVPAFIQAMALFPTPLSDTDCTTLTTL
jgi:hypothetical protein